jgi:hypothetical protein
MAAFPQIVPLFVVQRLSLASSVTHSVDSTCDNQEAYDNHQEWAQRCVPQLIPIIVEIPRKPSDDDNRPENKAKYGATIWKAEAFISISVASPRTTFDSLRVQLFPTFHASLSVVRILRSAALAVHHG